LVLVPARFTQGNCPYGQVVARSGAGKEAQRRAARCAGPAIQHPFRFSDPLASWAGPPRHGAHPSSSPRPRSPGRCRRRPPLPGFRATPAPGVPSQDLHAPPPPNPRSPHAGRPRDGARAVKTRLRVVDNRVFAALPSSLGAASLSATPSASRAFAGWGHSTTLRGRNLAGNKRNLAGTLAASTRAKRLSSILYGLLVLSDLAGKKRNLAGKRLRLKI
jgi:hypothetical protein